MRVYRHIAEDRAAEAARVYARTIEAIKTMDRLPAPMIARVQSNWPKEFAFHAEAIKWAVFAGEAAKSKAYKRLRARDFEDINLEFDEDDDRPKLEPVKRSAIADVEIAGAWFAALALRPENADEFLHAVEAFRRGKRKEVWVDDQRIMVMQARGRTLKTIGENLHGGKFNAEQIEGRIYDIAFALAEIARGR